MNGHGENATQMNESAMTALLMSLNFDKDVQRVQLVSNTPSSPTLLPEGRREYAPLSPWGEGLGVRPRRTQISVHGQGSVEQRATVVSPADGRERLRSSLRDFHVKTTVLRFCCGLFSAFALMV